MCMGCVYYACNLPNRLHVAFFCKFVYLLTYVLMVIGMADKLTVCVVD